MSANRQTFECKFFVDRDAKFAQMPHPNQRGGQSLPEILLGVHGFSDLGWDAHERIYLPATEKFPEAPYILEEEKSPRVKVEGLALSGQRKVRRRSGRGNQWVEHFRREIDDFMREFLLEQARARIGQKKMPSFHIVSSTFHGTNALPCTIVCESITGEPSMEGSYVTIQPWKNQVDMALVQRCFHTVLGFDAPPTAFRYSFEELLKVAYPRFLWCYNPTK